LLSINQDVTRKCFLHLRGTKFPCSYSCWIGTSGAGLTHIRNITKLINIIDKEKICQEKIVILPVRV
jgi:hypothetical protein